MKLSTGSNFPEPVPASSQLAVLPFLAAVEGYLLQSGSLDRLRLTCHRVMIREEVGYLQQLCTYLGTVKRDASGIGRIFPVSTGLMGEAALSREILRTRHYDRVDDLLRDLKSDLADTSDPRDLSNVPLSYLAIPLLGQNGDTVLVLYADAFEFGLFADNKRVQTIKYMCDGFCRLYDWIEEAKPFRSVRNYPLPKGIPAMEAPTIFKRIQERFPFGKDVPRFQRLDSFNFDAFVG